MTYQQAELLKILIDLDRRYYLRLLNNENVHRDERGVEVNRTFGCDPRTARSIVDAGMAGVVEIRQGQNYVFLGAYDVTKDLLGDDIT